MTINLANIQTGVSNDPPIITIYADSGLGKTTFAANAPNPIFVFTEKSLGKLNVSRFSYDDNKRYIAESFEETMESIVSLFGQHNYQTLVLDSLDWLEGLVENYLLRQRPTTDKGRPVKNIKDYGWNSGEAFILDYWNEYFDLIKQLQREKNMLVIQTAHRAIVKMTPPDTDAYTAYNLKLSARTRDKIVEGSDAVLYFSTKMGVTKEDVGFNQTRNRAVGAGDRYVYTEERPSHEGKNKYSLPYETPVKEKDWSDIWGMLSDHIPWFDQFKEEKPKSKPKKETKAEQKGEAA